MKDKKYTDEEKVEEFVKSQESGEIADAPTENVVGSPLERHVTLCGLMFGLRVFRHRIFESSEMLWRIIHVSHAGYSVGVNVCSPHGHGHGSHSRASAQRMFSVAGTAGKWRGWGGYGEGVPKGTVDEWREAMGIDWMKRDELTQAIPPAYSEYLWRQLLRRWSDS